MCARVTCADKGGAVEAAYHLRGMYRSTLTPSELCIPAADMIAEMEVDGSCDE